MEEIIGQIFEQSSLSPNIQITVTWTDELFGCMNINVDNVCCRSTKQKNKKERQPTRNTTQLTPMLNLWWWYIFWLYCVWWNGRIRGFTFSECPWRRIRVYIEWKSGGFFFLLRVWEIWRLFARFAGENQLKMDRWAYAWCSHCLLFALCGLFYCGGTLL